MHSVRSKVFGLLVCLLAVVLAVSPHDASTNGQSLSVGSKKFNESYILAEIISQLLEAGGHEVTRTFGLGGQSIPTGGTGSLTFPPIALQDLDPLMVSSTGSLLMTFRGQTVEGTSVLLTVARDLAVEECV